MAITINWPATNAAKATAIKIYASKTKLVDGALGTPIATLPGSAVTFSWTPPTDNTVYFFRIETIFTSGDGEESILGPNQPFGYFTTTGPGNQAPIRGDWELGYFGRVDSSLLLSGSALRTALGMTSGVGVPHTDAVLTYYYKFIINGKIIFSPVGPIAYGVTWTQIYNWGLMYGVDGDGFDLMPSLLSGQASVNQKKIIAAGGFNFLVRTYKSSLLPTNQALNYLVPANLEGSEYDLTLGRINEKPSMPFNQGPQWDDTTSMPTYQSWVGTLTQHLSSAQTNTRVTVVRGGSAGVMDLASQQNTQNTASTWTPLLELQF